MTSDRTVLPERDDARFAIQYGGLDTESARKAARHRRRVRVGELYIVTI
ncbi:MAG: hypothetical protein V8R08_00680 [Coriobacteriales bacterium]